MPLCLHRPTRVFPGGALAYDALHLHATLTAMGSTKSIVLPLLLHASVLNMDNFRRGLSGMRLPDVVDRRQPAISQT